MSNDGRLTLRLRLEDGIALAFFLINLALRFIVRGFEIQNMSPADVFIIIPAVALLMAKELVNYFVAGRQHAQTSAESPWEFARPYWEIFRDWFPFLIILLMYYSLWGNSTQLLVTHDEDAALMAWDQRLFGLQASIAMQRIISPPLTAWMDFAYFFHVLNIPIIGCFIYIRRPRRRFREMMSGLMVLCFFGLMGYLLVPAIGPMYALRDQYTVPLFTSLSVFNRQVELMDFARIRRDVFPSMHVAISFVMWLYAWRNSRRLFWLLSPLILSLWFSTVYLRYHYLVDVLAGLTLAPLCYVFSNFLFSRFGEIPIRVDVPPFLAQRFPWLRAEGSDVAAAHKIKDQS